jgi:hypothetical protein
MVNDTQCSSSTSSIDGTCTWIYGTNDGTNTNGSCIAVSEQNIECDDINRMSQCGTGGGITSLANGCSWIYGTNNMGDNSGNCVSINEQDISCEDINRLSQCAGGGGITTLVGKCGLYNSVCKTLCSEINETTCKSSSRSDECFWLESNGTQYSGGCMNKV